MKAGKNMTPEDVTPVKSMPVLFVGHGSPMNALEDNESSRTWRQVGQALPRPKAILCVSAHWETQGTLVTSMQQPRTIHDFGGFPRDLFEVRYPASGSPWLAGETQKMVKKFNIGLDETWGLDHGCWSILKQMYPKADIPVVQLSLDYTLSPQSHYELGKELAPLRQMGVLVLSSGNMVHNLGRVVIPGNSSSGFNTPYGLDWAIEANELFKQLIVEKRHAELANYKALGPSVQLSVPTPEHYLPLLYALALQEADDQLSFFNDVAMAGSLTMTSVLIQHPLSLRDRGVPEAG
jgi:4,5-DOPA dioxygenase extradiol